MEYTLIDKEVIIEEDVVIEPFVKIKGNSIVKKGAIIKSFTEIVDSIIGENTVVDSSNIHNSIIGTNNNIGPRAYIRNNTETR